MFRPFVLNYQNDPNTYNIDDEFMIGEDLLVAPILAPGQTQRLVYLPEGVWYDYWTGKKFSGKTAVMMSAPLEQVPIFVRGGAIIPKAPEMNYVGEKPRDPITFEVYPDAKGNARGLLYEDDGESPAYNKGVFRRTTVTFANNRIAMAEPEGSYNPGARRLVFRRGLSGPEIPSSSSRAR